MPDNKQLIERLRKVAKKRMLGLLPASALAEVSAEAADTIEKLETDLADERKKAADAARFAEKAHEEACAERGRPVVPEGVLEGLLSEKAVETAKDALREAPRPGSYLQNHHLRKALKAALQHAQEQVDGL